MKKFILTVFIISILPMAGFAQYWGPVYKADGTTRNICQDAYEDIKDTFDPEPFVGDFRTTGIYKEIYDETEEAFEEARKNYIHVSDGFFSHKSYSIPFLPTRRSEVKKAALARADKARTKISSTLRTDPFGGKPKDDTTERGAEFRKGITLDGEESEIYQTYDSAVEKYGKELQMYRSQVEGYLQTNPLFSLYYVTGDFEVLASLSLTEAKSLAAFLKGTIDTKGWNFYRYYNRQGHFVPPGKDLFNKGAAVVYGTDIIVKISDTLQVVIFPKNLDMFIRRVSKEDQDSKSWIRYKKEYR
ncbi:MAG: hypothetical protein IJ311_06090 [Elusimicrobiaceae bacterium]|nr:hypothetical protein [Elusimicrobiaceae bacterium]